MNLEYKFLAGVIYKINIPGDLASIQDPAFN